MSFSTESIMMSRHDSLAQVIAGRVPGYELLYKFGYNDNIDTAGTPEDIWEGGGLYTGQPNTGVAERLAVFSSSANDTAAGTGARTLVLFGLNSNYEEISEIVTLNGTTAVLTTQLFWRMYKGVVLSAGSGGANAGVLTARHQTTIANVFMQMIIGTNHTQIACFTIPAGKTCFIKTWQAFLSDAQSTYARMTGNVRTLGSVWRSLSPIALQREQNLIYDLDYSIMIPEKSDMRITCLEVSTNDTGISSHFTMLLIDNIKLIS